MITTLSITPLYAGLLGLLLLFLSALVVRGRMTLKVPFWDGGKKEMLQVMRVQGNFIEYVPMALLLLAMAEIQGTKDWLVHLLGITLVIGRILHAHGFHKSIGLTHGRFIGTVLTWSMIAISAILCVLGYFDLVFADNVF